MKRFKWFKVIDGKVFEAGGRYESLDDAEMISELIEALQEALAHRDAWRQEWRQCCVPREVDTAADLLPWEKGDE